jgi:Trypsin
MTWAIRVRNGSAGSPGSSSIQTSTRSTLIGDASLLVLSTPTTAQAIPLGVYPGDEALINAGSDAEIAGWGRILGNASATTLQWGQDVVQSPTYCLAREGQLRWQYDGSWQLCAIDAPTYSDQICPGDSGSPLMARDSAGTWVEIGITSSGIEDCSALGGSPLSAEPA